MSMIFSLTMIVILTMIVSLTMMFSLSMTHTCQLSRFRRDSPDFTTKFRHDIWRNGKLIPDFRDGLLPRSWGPVMHIVGCVTGMQNSNDIHVFRAQL